MCGSDADATADATATAAAAVGGTVELSLLCCTDEFIRGLNEQYRGIAAATDVLSFPQDDDTLLGDIVISTESASRQARARDYELRDEMRVLIVHGLLHLLGHDHERSESEAAAFSAMERRVLHALGWRGIGLVTAASDEPDEERH